MRWPIEPGPDYFIRDFGAIVQRRVPRAAMLRPERLEYRKMICDPSIARPPCEA